MKIVPCTLGIILFFWFSLTEISTPFLNYNWFMLKAQSGFFASKELWMKNGFVLLFTFGARWLITLASIPFTGWYIHKHFMSSGAGGPGGDPLAGPGGDGGGSGSGEQAAAVAMLTGFGWKVVQGYLFFFALGVCGMLALNSYWYSVLLGKAFDALSRKKREAEGEGEAQTDSTGRKPNRVVLEPRLSTTDITAPNGERKGLAKKDA